MNKNPYQLCFLLSIILIILGEAAKAILEIDALQYNSMAEKLSSQQLNQYFEFQNKWKWLSYVFIPIIHSDQNKYNSIAMYIGTFFFSKK